MKNEFRICDKCRGVPFKELEQKLKELDHEAEIKIGCQNVCGIGRTKPFVIVNKKLVIGDNVDDVIEKVKGSL